MKARPFPVRAVWGLWLVCRTIAENTNGVTWQYPTEGLTFYYLDTVQVTYTSNFSGPFLYTFCLDDVGNTIPKKLDEVTPYNGTVPTVLDWTDASSACWFNLRPGHEAILGSNSDRFEYKIGQRSQTTLGPETSTETSTTSIAMAGATSSASPAPVFSTGLSTGAQAGIGVGAALAGLALGAFAATMLIRRRNRQQQVVGEHQHASMPVVQYPGSDYQGSLGYGPSPTTIYTGQSILPNVHAPNPQELETEREPAELDGRWRTTSR
ncbi:hypothetical protein F5X99DRAFT_351216 [Biscogniauxia marginata]|nr:hypothetical protein F5X99DRAFT_351216 [Biscogniauxia marginata]